MGSLWTKLFGGKPAVLPILGLDCAGKTTLLFGMSRGEQVKSTIPTIGFNVEEIKVGDTRLLGYDVGGGDKIRELWTHYYANCAGVVFIIDSTDRQRVYQMKDLIARNLQDPQLVKKPILILCNKQDIPGALTQ